VYRRHFVLRGNDRGKVGVKFLVTGRGKGASWEIRGRQLGDAIHATVDPEPASFAGYHAAIVVKRPRAHVVEAIHKAGVPLIWDVVDAWPQPMGNDWDKKRCMLWLRAEVGSIRPAAIVAATKAMAADCAEFGIPVLALPHHARPKQKINPLREKVLTVLYQGGDTLWTWQPMLERQCKKRGWEFWTDHSKTADVPLAHTDIVVAVRSQTGYAARNWKSGVKLANAQGSGTPSVVSREAGYVETADSRQYFADDEAQLSACFDALTGIDARREQVEMYKPLTLGVVRNHYLSWLRSMSF